RNRTSSNPALRRMARAGFPHAAAGEPTMTVGGTINRPIGLIALVVIGAAWAWSRYVAGHGATPGPAYQAVTGYLIGGVIAGLILCLVTVFKPQWAKVTAPLYAIAEGLAIGGISAVLNHLYPGIVLEAVGLTFGVMFAMLILYRTGLVKVTPKFRRGVIIATFGIFAFYMGSWIASMFGADTSMLFGSHSIVSIIISLVIVGIAALNLVLDFDFIERGSAAGLPRDMEWYGAFALTV